METKFQCHKHYSIADYDQRINFEKMFFVAVMDIDLDSVPGICCMSRLGTTNRQVLGHDGQCFSVDRLRLLKTAVLDRYNAVCSGNMDADPLKVFIKPEPHKKSKLLEGRYRLITSVSLVDALVDRILFMKLMYRVITTFDRSNVMIGWSPSNGGYRLVEAIFGNKETVSIDKKSWDWTVKKWLLDAVCDLIVRVSVDPPSWWVLAVRTRFELLFGDPDYVFPDGTHGRQPVPGAVKSGCYLTILINSYSQFILHQMSLTRLKIKDMPIIVLGDDTLQVSFPAVLDYVSYQESLGFRIEFEVSKVIEFAGFIFGKGYIPAYRAKHMFQLRHLTTDEEIASQTLSNYMVLYYFVPEVREYLRNLILLLALPSAGRSEEGLRALACG